MFVSEMDYQTLSYLEKYESSALLNIILITNKFA